MFVRLYAVMMDDNELNTDYSESDFEDSGNENYVSEGNFLPY